MRTTYISGPKYNLAFFLSYSTQTNTEMTDLLKEKAENGELDACGDETLDVINKIK